ncbi:MAG: SDR family oxidoreductase [Deltaproteobacteria bacterium]|jgi:3-oxoacyl-[acyl-carrier protein] reductase|nr:SDR family oxidoreductase [Deltaproteobacteria bacterium]
MTSNISDVTVIVTGTGYRSLSQDTAPIGNVFKHPRVKANIGAWVAKELVEQGFEVLIVSRTVSKLQTLTNSIRIEHPNNRIDYCAVDLLDSKAVAEMVENIQRGKLIYLVHCAGLSAGSYKLPNDNPYLRVEETPIDLPCLEFDVIVKSLLILVQALLPRFELQEESRIVVISSMSGVRAVPLGYSHSAAKAGLHNAVRSLALELNKRRIYVSEVLPGMVNTGIYDPPAVQMAIAEMGKYFGYDYKDSGLPQMPPKDVADAVKLCLTSEAHILSINLVAKGQWPNLSS